MLQSLTTESNGDFFFFFLRNSFIFIIYLFILFIFLAVLGLRFCARAFSSCGKRGPLFIAVRGPLTIVASVVVAHGPSCSAACGILPDQGSNPRPLHWQADSQPPRHQGSPVMETFLSGTFWACHGSLILQRLMGDYIR